MEGRLPVAVVTAAYPAPSDPTRAVFLENFIDALAGEGFEPTVVAPRVASSDPLREKRQGFHVERFAYPSGGRRLKEHGAPGVVMMAAYLASGLVRTLQVVHRIAPRLIYAHWVIPAGLIGAVAARLTGLPLVLHAHGSDIHRFAISSSVTKVLSLWTLGRATRVLAASKELVRTMEEQLGLPCGCAAVVPMGVDSRLFYPSGRQLARRRLGLSDDRLEVLFVGDLEPWKGIVPLARRLLSDSELGKIRLHIVGDGVLRPELEVLRQGHAGRLELYGSLPQKDVALWYRAADLLVLPSRGEGSPLAVMEALSSGLPVLATPVGGIPELVSDRRTGWLVPSTAFLECLRDLLENPEELEEARQVLARESMALEMGLVQRARDAAAILASVALYPEEIHHRGTQRDHGRNQTPKNSNHRGHGGTQRLTPPTSATEPREEFNAEDAKDAEKRRESLLKWVNDTTADSLRLRSRKKDL